MSSNPICKRTWLHAFTNYKGLISKPILLLLFCLLREAWFAVRLRRPLHMHEARFIRGHIIWLPVGNHFSIDKSLNRMDVWTFVA